MRRRRAGGRNGAEKWRETEVGVGREAGKVQGDTSAPTGVASRAAAEALRWGGRWSRGAYRWVRSGVSVGFRGPGVRIFLGFSIFLINI